MALVGMVVYRRVFQAPWDAVSGRQPVVKSVAALVGGGRLVTYVSEGCWCSGLPVGPSMMGSGWYR